MEIAKDHFLNLIGLKNQIDLKKYEEIKNKLFEKAQNIKIPSLDEIELIYEDYHQKYEFIRFFFLKIYQGTIQEKPQEKKLE